MSEQLWYTWSKSGFGIANDYRVRAASPKLADVEGPRVRSFINLVNYTLSPDVDPFLPPQEAPLCLAFLKTEDQQETVLIQKTYIGLDGIKRPGAYFSHLLAELPEVPSPCIGGRVPFSAREAIALWRSPLWRYSEEGWPAGKRDLESIVSTDLYADLYINQYSNKYAGPLNVQAVEQIMQMPDLFSLVMQAFLTLALSAERRRLYLLGAPDTVAALIWGITHALPRTLDIMRDLTFSTFESNVEATTNPLIVGTCWLPQHLKKGRENVLLDVPPIYYQPNNAYGITINCEPSYTHTPFQPEQLAEKYTRFVLDCYTQRQPGLQYLKKMLDEAERGDIYKISDLFTHYIPYQTNLPKEEVNRLLKALNNRMVTLINHATNALQQEKLPAVLTEVEPMMRIQIKAEGLQRPSVLQSIISLMSRDPDWWQSQGKELLANLYKLSSWYSSDQLTQLANTFLEKIASSREWKKKQGADLISTVQHLVPEVATPVETLSAFTQGIVNRVLDAQKELRQSLYPLAYQITDQLIQALRNDDYQSTAFWNHVFIDCADVQRPPLEVWAYLLQHLSAVDYSHTYQEWWQQYGQKKLPTFRSQAHASPTSTLSSAFSTYATAIAPRLGAALQSDNQTEAAFWAAVFQTIAPVASEQAAWASLLQQLGALSYTSAYAQWWKNSGTAAVREILSLANRNPNSVLALALSTFIQQVASSLALALRSGQPVAYTFWKDLLANIAPYKSQPAHWARLLLDLRELLTTPGFQQWWSDQGRDATAALTRLAATDATIAEQLSLFRQKVAQVLGNIILAEAQQAHLESEGMISFLFEVLTTATPAQDNQIALSLLQTLSNAYLYQRISWERRSQLLRYWQQVVSLNGEVSPLLRPWLEVSWADLARLLALGLPTSWSKYAITKALETSSSVPARQVLDVVERFSTPFEEVLVTLFSLPQTQIFAMQFFNFLAQNHYSQSLTLLVRLATACGYRSDLTERLLQMVQPVDEREIANMLELHCQDWISSYELPPGMLRLIESYLAHFDVAYLDADPTRNLLQRLLQRAQGPTSVLPASLQQTVEGWYQIAEFLALPQASPNALRDLSHSMRNMIKLAPEVQKKLSAKLLPHLVAMVETDTDLTRVIDILGRAASLELLQDMARLVGEQYRQERSLERLAPYVRTILAEGRFLQSPEKEQFVTTCFRLLFAHVDTRTRDKFKNDALWPKALLEEWKSVQSNVRPAEMSKSLNRFREAVRKLFIPEIADTYDPSFASSLNTDELWLLEQANAFVSAYNAGNDEEMLQIHEAIKNRYPQPFMYTQPQLDRIQLARQQRLAQQQRAVVQQQASVPPGNMPFSGIQAAGSLAIWQESNALGAQTSSNSPSPFTQPQPATPSAPAPDQRSVATVRGRRISATDLAWVAMLIAPYLKWRREQFALYVQTIEATGSADEKKGLRSAQQSIEDIEKLLQNEQQLRRLSLDHLIDDVLIEQAIKFMGQEQQENLALEVKSRLERLYQEITAKHGYYLDHNSPLRSKDDATVKNVKNILAIFVWRQRFEEYLRSTGVKLADWLKEQRQQEKDITIDYEQAGIKGRKGLMSFFGH